MSQSPVTLAALRYVLINWDFWLVVSVRGPGNFTGVKNHDLKLLDVKKQGLNCMRLAFSSLLVLPSHGWVQRLHCLGGETAD